MKHFYFLVSISFAGMVIGHHAVAELPVAPMPRAVQPPPQTDFVPYTRIDKLHLLEEMSLHYPPMEMYSYGSKVPFNDMLLPAYDGFHGRVMSKPFWLRRAKDWPPHEYKYIEPTHDEYAELPPDKQGDHYLESVKAKKERALAAQQKTIQVCQPAHAWTPGPVEALAGACEIDGHPVLSLEATPELIASLQAPKAIVNGTACMMGEATTHQDAIDGYKKHIHGQLLKACQQGLNGSSGAKHVEVSQESVEKVLTEIGGGIDCQAIEVQTSAKK